MAKFDEQLSRMEHLMNYQMPVNESRKNIEYCAAGADGKYYGIIKEGAYFYIKSCTDSSKKNLAEAYDYINGITAKKEHQYKGYNEATKHLELKLMSLNEAYNVKQNVSTVDFKKHEKALATLTEEARVELDRMHAIYENSMTIGMNNTGNPEAPKTATFTPTIGTPFTEKGEAKLDKDLKATANDPKKVGGPFEKEEKVTDADMESDKNPKGGDAKNGMKAAEYVPADAVAAKKPSGGKVVRVNEAEEDILGINPVDAEEIAEPIDNVEPTSLESDADLDALLGDSTEMDDTEMLLDDNGMTDFEFSQQMAGEGEPEDINDNNYEGDEFEPDSEFMSDVAFDRKYRGNTLESIVKDVCDNIIKESKKNAVNESFQKYIDKIVKEEVTRLNVFGKHPGYRKKPMTTPSNTEVINADGDRDWNDASAKGEQPFGTKIGSSAPFDIKVLTDAVVAVVKETLKKK